MDNQVGFVTRWRDVITTAKTVTRQQLLAAVPAIWPSGLPISCRRSHGTTAVSHVPTHQACTPPGVTPEAQAFGHLKKWQWLAPGQGKTTKQKADLRPPLCFLA